MMKTYCRSRFEAMDDPFNLGDKMSVGAPKTIQLMQWSKIKTGSTGIPANILLPETES